VVEKEIFPKKKFGHFILYPGAAHGWTVRNDQNVPEEKKAKEDAAKAAIEFLQKNLA